MRTHGRRKDVARNIQDNQGTCLVKCGDAQIQWEIGKKDNSSVENKCVEYRGGTRIRRHSKYQDTCCAKCSDADTWEIGKKRETRRRGGVTCMRDLRSFVFARSRAATQSPCAGWRNTHDRKRKSVAAERD